MDQLHVEKLSCEKPKKKIRPLSGIHTRDLSDTS